MEVILKEDVKSLGKVGDVVKVRDGYARNFLFPRKMALPVTPGNLKQLEQQKKAMETKLASMRAEIEEQAARLANIVCTIKKKAGEEGHIFGSVTSAEIAETIAEQGITVDKRKIDIREPIKQLGEYSVSVQLHPEVTAEVKVNVVREE